jgi:2-C-methyl-D-erythritol 2,4-cyclodiphosphate synthase
MKTCLAEVMQIDESKLSLKATTTERLGFVGREEGVSAYCVALIHT